METRKLQRIGGCTLSVSLPKAWADASGLRAGDRIGLEPLAGGELRICPLREDGAREARGHELDVTGLTPKQVEQRVLALYVAGRDVIGVQAAPALPAETLRLLESLPRRVSGLEIVEQARGRVVLRDMLDPRGFDARRAFERMYAIASGVHREVLAALGEGDVERLRRACLRQEDLERVGFVALKQQRLLAERRFLDPTAPHPVEALTFAAATEVIQRLGRQGVELAGAAEMILRGPVDPHVRGGLVEIGSRVLQVCDEAARALYKSDLAAADGALAKLDALGGRLREFHEFVAGRSLKMGAMSPCILTIRVLPWMHASAALGGSLAELAIQRAYQAATPPA